jgi:CRISPR-associated exonuclease Cas4
MTYALLVLIALVFLAGGLLALRWAAGRRHKAGLPVGRVVYADTGDWRPAEKPLFSSAYGLTGKPDYLVSTRAGIIPVEVKSGATPPQPYPSHILQLAAYCLLVEETERKPPPFGLIRYPEATFRVEYTPDLRDELLSLLRDMRGALQSSVRDVPRSHDEPRRCALCGYREVCGQAVESSMGL